ncbi:hypothetical protein AVEN_59718-1 [Araneus ventricosus]|uniref:BTB domain-containing protein n=1 Tax=Araneus ventricosus TaxID=182803 RepID=A0A4Y2BMS6_ARAVE|nr:hypothetical protein AVEN_59718-1 [Araneus ventricosus]
MLFIGISSVLFFLGRKRLLRVFEIFPDKCLTRRRKMSLRDSETNQTYRLHCQFRTTTKQILRECRKNYEHFDFLFSAFLLGKKKISLKDSEIIISEVTTALEIKIEDFRNATEQVSKECRKNYEHFDFLFSALVLPNGNCTENDGWVVVLINETMHFLSFLHDDDLLTWTVSVIDIEGNSRLPISFTKSPFARTDLSDLKYLERSFILNQADELLPDDVLTLRFDISYIFTWCKSLVVEGDITPISTYFYYNYFLFSTPNAICVQDGVDCSKNEVSIDIQTCNQKVFDFTSQVLTLPQFHDLRKRFGVYGVSPWPCNLTSVSKDNIFEHVWIFDTDPDRFLISLDGQEDDLGPRLLKASSVIRHCVHSPMKEQSQRRIQLSNVKSETFRFVLFYLTKGTLFFPDFHKLLDVYEMSHFYEMKDLQQKCAEHLVALFRIPTVVDQKKVIADLYSDEYLLNLLRRRWSESQILEEKPNFQCFI